MAGYGVGTNDTVSLENDYTSVGKVEGFNIGLYATWYENKPKNLGIYADVWLMWSDMKGLVHGEDLEIETYKLGGFIGSMEGGYLFEASEIGKYTMVVHPRIQAIWLGVNADELVEVTGTVVTGTSNYVQTNIGLRIYLKRYLGDSHSSFIQPFGELNWIFNTKAFTVALDDNETTQAGTRHIAEMKIGLEANFNKTTNAWISFTYHVGTNSYRDSRFLLGLQHSF